MTQVIDWRPPPERPGLILHAALRAELLERPGEWAFVRVWKSHRKKRIKVPSGFETVQRHRIIDGRRYTELYARAMRRQ